jgi:hypothetical protein
MPKIIIIFPQGTEVGNPVDLEGVIPRKGEILYSAKNFFIVSEVLHFIGNSSDELTAVVSVEALANDQIAERKLNKIIDALRTRGSCE